MRLLGCILLVALFLSSQQNITAQDIGEINFSKQMIDPSSPANLETKFEAGDHIYAFASFPKTIIDLLKSKTVKKAEVEIILYELKPPLYDYQQPSEMQLEFSSMWVSGSLLNHNRLPVDIVPNPDKTTAYGGKEIEYKKFGANYYGPVLFAKALSILSPGEHKIIMKVNINYSLAAEGSFVISGNDFSVYESMSEKLNEGAGNIATQAAELPKEERTDKTLEAEMITVLKSSNTYKERIKGEVLKLVIVDPDWTIRRNELTGIILDRYIRATAAVKNSDGTCTVWQFITFQQDYVSNVFQKMKFSGVGDPYKIPCENVK
ncbi:MAG: hypothetical protein IPJ75_15450 [Ignavibacteriales bacterium]|nr:hypothetical protein [Ignavibacteriales bacterium]